MHQVFTYSSLENQTAIPIFMLSTIRTSRGAICRRGCYHVGNFTWGNGSGLETQSSNPRVRENTKFREYLLTQAFLHSVYTTLWPLTKQDTVDRQRTESFC